MVRAKKTAGVDAEVSCKTRLLHPSAIVREKVPGVQIGFHHETLHLTIKRKEEKRVNRRQQWCYVLHHDSYVTADGMPIELHAVCKHCKIITEGPPAGFFRQEEAPQEEAEAAAQQEPAAFPEAVLAFEHGQDPGILIQNNIAVDDDNEPAPENAAQAPNDRDGIYQGWGFNGVCERRSMGKGKWNPRLLDYHGNYDYISLFEQLFPMTWVNEVLLVETNNLLNEELTYGEFLRWLGLWMMMGTIEGFSRRDFWATSPVTMYRGSPYRFNDLMSRSRFEDILECIRYTSKQSTNTDPFWEVRQMVDCWNRNMEESFFPSYISCLDESMSPWTNQYNCPGYMYVPRKPHPFGNEYHSVCCGVSRIMWRIEMVEGKDTPAGTRKEFDDKGGSTVGLLLRMCKPFFYTGMALVLDSGFCVLKGLIELRKVGVFGASVIKKRRYWPKYIPGDDNNKHFEDKPVGSYDVLNGTLDGTNFTIHCFKEPDYVMQLMATYGTDEEMEDGKTQRTTINNDGERTMVNFKYRELFYNHFKYRNLVDLHNQCRHQPLSLESIWATRRWPNRVFCFLIAITEVNVKLAAEYFGTTPKMSMLQSRRLIAEAFITNDKIQEERLGRTVMRLRPAVVCHGLMTVPSFQRYNGVKFVKAGTRFPQRKCTTCGRKVRTYCQCNPNNAMCQTCHTKHCVDLATADPHGD